MRLKSLFVVALVSGCAFTTERGEPNNVVIGNGVAYVSLAEDGIGIVDLDSGAILARVPPPVPADRVDDLSIAGKLLFVLDATEPGYLAVFDLTDPMAPLRVKTPVEVPVGPFSGVSAANGVVAVSGGTGEMTVRTYGADGTFGTDVSKLDTRGQPDILLSSDGKLGFMSSHFAEAVDGDTFGLSILRIPTPPAPIEILSRIGLDDAGFSGGAAHPANWPVECATIQGYLLAAHGGGLAIIDIADPAQPKVEQVVPFDLEGTSVDVYDNRAFVVGVEPAPKLVILNLSRPKEPQVVATIPLHEDAVPTGIAVDGRRSVIAANDGGVIVIPHP